MTPTRPDGAVHFSWVPIKSENDSGTPAALLEAIGSHDLLLDLPDVEDVDVLVEFPFGPEWQEHTGRRRFVRLRRPIDGLSYALIR